MVLFSKFILFVIFLIGASAPTQAVSSSSNVSNTFSSVDFKKIIIGNLKDADHNKFIDFFANTFEEAYKDCTLEKLGKTDYTSKREWLTDLARKEVEASKACEHKNSHYLVFYNSTDIVGYLSFQLEEDGKVVYFAQACIDPTLWGKECPAYVIKEIVPLYAPKAMRYTLMVRISNKRAIRTYDKIGFVIDETSELVKQHGYDPKYYLGMYKDITNQPK